MAFLGIPRLVPHSANSKAWGWQAKQQCQASFSPFLLSRVVVLFFTHAFYCPAEPNVCLWMQYVSASKKPCAVALPGQDVPGPHLSPSVTWSVQLSVLPRFLGAHCPVLLAG